MTDPSDALMSFQEVLLLGGLELQRGTLDRDLYVYGDSPTGKPRFTYVKLEGQTVTAFVMLAAGDGVEGLPSFDIGYAVPEAYRNQGRARELVGAAILELQHGMAKIGIPTFYVEAVIGTDNRPSQRVAEQVVSTSPTAVTDSISGLPALHYVRKVGDSRS